jgi:hypothetical protein
MPTPLRFVGIGQRSVHLHSNVFRDMADQEQNVCSVCRERPATYHACYGHTGETRDLCVTCFEQTASPAELESYRQCEQMLRNAKCKYCGAPAVGGSMSYGIPGVLDEQNAFWWCEPCRLDLVDFASRPENAIPDFDVADETRLEAESHRLAERTRRQEEFMRQRVSERSR